MTTNFKQYDAIIKTKKLMRRYGDSLPPSTTKAHAYSISLWDFFEDETIADRLSRDHNVLYDYALRAADMMCRAGAAIHHQTEKEKNKKLFGEFEFLDGSRFR